MRFALHRRHSIARLYLSRSLNKKYLANKNERVANYCSIDMHARAHSHNSKRQSLVKRSIGRRIGTHTERLLSIRKMNVSVCMLRFSPSSCLCFYRLLRELTNIFLNRPKINYTILKENNQLINQTYKWNEQTALENPPNQPNKLDQSKIDKYRLIETKTKQIHTSISISIVPWNKDEPIQTVWWCRFIHKSILATKTPKKIPKII